MLPDSCHMWLLCSCCLVAAAPVFFYLLENGPKPWTVDMKRKLNRLSTEEMTIEFVSPGWRKASSKTTQTTNNFAAILRISFHNVFTAKYSIIGCVCAAIIRHLKNLVKPEVTASVCFEPVLTIYWSYTFKVQHLHLLSIRARYRTNESALSMQGPLKVI